MTDIRILDLEIEQGDIQETEAGVIQEVDRTAFLEEILVIGTVQAGKGFCVLP